MKENEKKIEGAPLSSEGNTSSSQIDFSNLFSELTKIKNDGNNLYKQKKIEEAKNKFLEGVELYNKQSHLINKERGNNEQCKEVYKKILSNTALCFYKQERYKESIEYDLKLISIDPKFGKSIVRLFKSYSKLNLIQQSVFYGDLFLELGQSTREKFKGTKEKVIEEKQRLKDIQDAEKDKLKKDFAKYGVPAIVLLLGILIYLLFRKK